MENDVPYENAGPPNSSPLEAAFPVKLSGTRWEEADSILDMVASWDPLPLTNNKNNVASGNAPILPADGRVASVSGLRV